MTSAANPRYRLQQPLGHGGQGRTFRALDTETGQAVAVKVIQLSSATGWKRFDLFERECEVLRALDHPGIPRYLDTYALEEAGQYCLVMEFVEGSTLRQQLERQQPVPEAQLWNVLHQTLEILDYLHGLRPPVIHRDVKPDNLIRRDANGALVLVDFGGVRVALRPDGGSTVVGTFGYMAPEQLHGDATAATDIFGLGATLAALATGTPADKLPRKGLRVDLQAVMPDTPLRGLLQQMLEPDPDDRLASVQAVRQAARGATGDGDLAEAAPRPRADAAPDDHRRPRGPDEPLGPFLLRMVNSLGYLGLVLAATVLVPLLFFVIRRIAAPASRPQLREREDEARRAINRRRKSLRRLIEGQGRGQGQGPGRERQSPRLSPGAPPPRPSPRSPPGPRRRGRGRGGWHR